MLRRAVARLAAVRSAAALRTRMTMCCARGLATARAAVRHAANSAAAGAVRAGATQPLHIRAISMAVVGAGAGVAGVGASDVKSSTNTGASGSSGSGDARAASVTGLSALVIRTRDIEALRAFYEALGLHFELEKHGGGPRHYSCVVGGVVFEIYPLTQAQPKAVPNADDTTALAAAAAAAAPPKADSTTRLSFNVTNADALYERLTKVDANGNASAVTVVSAPRETEWGRAFVVRDLDGRSVELVQPPVPVRAPLPAERPGDRILLERGLPLDVAVVMRHADADDPMGFRAVERELQRRIEAAEREAKAAQSGDDAGGSGSDSGAEGGNRMVRFSSASTRSYTTVDPDTGDRVVVTTVKRDGATTHSTSVIRPDGRRVTFAEELEPKEALRRAAALEDGNGKRKSDA